MGGDNFFVVWQNAKGISGDTIDLYSLIIDTLGNIKKQGYVAPQSYNEKEPSLASGVDKILLVWSDNRTGNFDIYGMFIDSSSIGVEEVDLLNNSKIILSIYPNPFIRSAEVKFQIPRQLTIGHVPFVSLKVYDALGRLCRVLIEKPARDIYTIYWDGKNDEKKEVSAGIYFVELCVNGQKKASKLIKLKGG